MDVENSDTGQNFDNGDNQCLEKKPIRIIHLPWQNQKP